MKLTKTLKMDNYLQRMQGPLNDATQILEQSANQVAAEVQTAVREFQAVNQNVINFLVCPVFN